MSSALYAYFILPKTWQKWILFACSPALAILGNLTRIVMLSLGSLQFGSQFAIGTNDEPSWFHEAAGYAVFSSRRRYDGNWLDPGTRLEFNFASIKKVGACPMAVEKVDVIGTPLAVVNYETALAEVLQLAREPRATAIAAANTHLVAEARQTPSFQEVIRQFDLILPDGMPLIWSMRRRGVPVLDRVYGPYFMQYVLQHTPRPWKHFFFGGTEEDITNARCCDAADPAGS